MKKQLARTLNLFLVFIFFNSDPWSCEWRHAATGAGQEE